MFGKPGPSQRNVRRPVESGRLGGRFFPVRQTAGKYGHAGAGRHLDRQSVQGDRRERIDAGQRSAAIVRRARDFSKEVQHQLRRQLALGPSRGEFGRQRKSAAGGGFVRDVAQVAQHDHGAAAVETVGPGQLCGLDRASVGRRRGDRHLAASDRSLRSRRDDRPVVYQRTGSEGHLASRAAVFGRHTARRPQRLVGRLASSSRPGLPRFRAGPQRRVQYPVRRRQRAVGCRQQSGRIPEQRISRHRRFHGCRGRADPG